jgi:hypothetical protein
MMDILLQTDINLLLKISQVRRTVRMAVSARVRELDDSFPQVGLRDAGV